LTFLPTGLFVHSDVVQKKGRQAPEIPSRPNPTTPGPQAIQKLFHVLFPPRWLSLTEENRRKGPLKNDLIERTS
jgi:hypothetical protein